MRLIKTNFKRANIVESYHKIKLLIKDLNGKTLINSGNENDFIYPRSSIKIFQAIPFINSNAINKFKLNSKIIALSCSSHRGESFHLKELEKWSEKIKFNIKNLQCGTHYPLNQKAAVKILKSNKKINQLYNNCAGKHLAMITSCIMNNYNTKNYLEFNHPHQIKIREIFEKFSGNKINIINYGIDGCSAPQYSFKIKDINSLLLNLIKSYKNKFENSSETKVLIDSVIKNPNYIGGSDSLDSTIMKISNKKIFCKGGAEGVFLFIDLKKEIGGVIKVADGNERAIPYLIFSLFKKLKIMNSAELTNLKKIYSFKLLNHANLSVGSVETML